MRKQDAEFIVGALRDAGFNFACSLPATQIHALQDVLQDDPEMAEDLVAAAFNDAANKLAAETQARMAGVAGGMNLPPGFSLPF